MPFGICSTPSNFQEMLDTIMNGLSGTRTYMDDILVFSSCEKDMLKRLNCVFGKLAFNGLKLNLEKCELGKPSVE